MSEAASDGFPLGVSLVVGYGFLAAGLAFLRVLLGGFAARSGVGGSVALAVAFLLAFVSVGLLSRDRLAWLGGVTVYGAVGVGGWLLGGWLLGGLAHVAVAAYLFTRADVFAR
ncbi:MAG: hypothetical protein ABEJ04_02335 [Halobacteriaceae archaeon]